jgi:hypothetical protein
VLECRAHGEFAREKFALSQWHIAAGKQIVRPPIHRLADRFVVRPPQV